MDGKLLAGVLICGAAILIFFMRRVYLQWEEKESERIEKENDAMNNRIASEMFAQMSRK